MGYLNFVDDGILIAPILTSGQIMVSGGANVKVMDGFNASGTINMISGSLDFRNSTHLSFDGSNDKVTFAGTQVPNPDTGDYTWTAWIKTTDDGDNYLYGAKESTGDARIEWRVGVGTDDSRLRLLLRDNTSVIYKDTDVVVNDGKWHHVASVWDTSENTILHYVDGVYAGGGTSVISNTINPDGAQSLGARGGTSSFYNGLMNDVKFYASALTSGNIYDMYNNQYVGSPVARWNMNEGESTVLNNDGSTNSPGTIDGATWINPDVTSSTTLQSAKSEVTAPRGYWRIQQSYNTANDDAYNITAGGLFYHNSGTIGTMNNPLGNEAREYKMGLANPVYNWSGSTNYMEGDMWVQGPIYHVSGQTRTGGNILQMGTDTSATTVSHPESSFQINNDGGTFKGYNPLYPAVFGPNCRSIYLGSNKETRYLQDIKITEQEAFNGNTMWLAHADADGVLVISGNVEVNKSAGNKFDWATGSLQLTKGARLDIKQQMDVWDKASVNVSGGTLVLSGMSIYSSGTFTGGASSNILYNNQNQHNDNFRMPYVASGTQFINSQYRQDMIVSQNIGSNLIIGENNGTYFRVGDTAHNGTHLQAKNFFIGGHSTDAIFNQNQNKVTFSGNTISHLGGIIGYSYLKFNNTPGYNTATQFVTATSGQSFTTAGMTIDTWIKTTDDTGIKFLFAGFYAGSTNYNKLYMLSNGKVVGRIAGMGGSADLTSTTEVNDGNWHHIALTYYDTGDGGNDNIQRLYIDGKLEAEDLLNNTGGAPYTLNTFHIGSSYTSGDGAPKYGFKGDMARFSLWKTALTQEQIRRMMFMNHETVSGSGYFDLQHCLSWFQMDGKTKTTTLYNLGSGSLANDGTISDSSNMWSIPLGYGNWTQTYSDLGANNQLNLTHNDDIVLAANSLRLGNVSGGATASKKLIMTRWDGEQSCAFYGVLKWGPGVTEQNGYSTFGKNGTPWNTVTGKGYIDPMGGDTSVPFADFQSYWSSDGSLSSTGGQPEVTVQYCLPTGDMELGGDFTASQQMMPSMASKSRRIYTNGFDLITKQWYSYGGTHGALALGAGSTLYFKNDNDGFIAGGTSSLLQIKSSGMAGANFKNCTSSNDGFQLPAELNIGKVGQNYGVYSGSFSISLWSYLPLHYSGTTSTKNVGFFGGGGGGQTGGGVAAWIYQGIGDYGGIYWDVAGTVYAERSSISSALVAADFGKLTHWVFILDRRAGNDSGEGIMKVWKNGVVNASGNVKTSGDAFIAVSSSKDLEFGNGGLDGAAWSGNGKQAFTLGDCRIFRGAQNGTDGALTDAQVATLYNNGKTLMDGSATDYPDPTNSLGAKTWYKMDLDESTWLTSKVDSVSGTNATFVGNYAGKTGFSAIRGSGTTTNWDINEGVGDRQFQNMLISGSKDIIVSVSGGAGRVAKWPGDLVTSGKVVIE
tara:strand:- start:10621 stop:14880 length:4260 start_codon:yes stop_codon:yes gene_type:complete